MRSNKFSSYLDERRARFLSKIVLSPPSPTATLTPKTPPESPAIFHYSLPSPGLNSPLTLFESLSENGSPYSCEPWIEQVDFRLVNFSKAKEVPPRKPAPGITRLLPSLDQISARLHSQEQTRPRPQNQNRAPRLPRFLTPDLTAAPKDAPAPEPAIAAPPKLVVVPTVLHESRSVATSPTRVSAATQTRERRALDMLSTIRRRTQASDDVGLSEADMRKSKWKRFSAPADLMPHQPRTGFEHPVLSLPGGF